MVSSHFLEISADEKVQNMRLDGQIVPFIEKEWLESGAGIQAEGGVFFAVQDNEVFYDDKRFQQEIGRLKQELEEEEREDGSSGSGGETAETVESAGETAEC